MSSPQTELKKKLYEKVLPNDKRRHSSIRTRTINKIRLRYVYMYFSKDKIRVSLIIIIRVRTFRSTVNAIMLLSDYLHTFYRAMLRSRARSCDDDESSVRPSLTLRYPYHTGWNTSKIISRLISLRFWLWPAPPNIVDVVQWEDS